MELLFYFPHHLSVFSLPLFSLTIPLEYILEEIFIISMVFFSLCLNYNSRRRLEKSSTRQLSLTELCMWRRRARKSGRGRGRGRMIQIVDARLTQECCFPPLICKPEGTQLTQCNMK